MFESEIVKDARRFIHSLFRRSLPKTYYYHSEYHTKDVVSNVREIAIAEALKPSDLELVTLAALFHDSGFTVARDGHEEKSVEIAAKFLRKHGYAPKKVKSVLTCIMGTKIPQQPKNRLTKIVADADLLLFGKNDCLRQGELLRREVSEHNGKKIPRSDWLRQSILFLGMHHYWTPYAKKNYTKRKKENIALLQLSLEKLNVKRRRVR